MFCIVLAALCLTTHAGAARAASAYVIDGDTLDVNGERIRIRSEVAPIDAPELRKAKCPLELFRAQAARERLTAIKAGDWSIHRTGERDRRDRSVAVMYAEGLDVGSMQVR